ncbi:MAG: hypothetical protein C0601_08765 [Candidatus Muiribacterium halophilum]|uniref:Peptidase M14 carboxypeptidase A domain-containing protein n=1 Tax=Muiribacterium halophilum TaxID=2053465 RepID=A0A2N5ZE71_MUIH1|nr:MAG: hypothetical protein C0601_08765 [Candidatus Muirbacterium halophilum]
MMDMNKMISEIKSFAKGVDDILSPVEVIEWFENIAKENNKIKEEIYNKDETGRDIKCYVIGKGETILLYAFPDPGEAVGGTSIKVLTQLLLDEQSSISKMPYRFVIVPCLNFLDQPNNGVKNERLQKTRAQEVDWCLSDPRLETRAIIKIAKKYEPKLTFPLHDEWHSKEYVDPYLGVDPVISKKLATEITEIFAGYDMEMNSEYDDPEMGKGFFNMKSIGPEYKNCTFSLFAKMGHVFVCEVPYGKNLKASSLVEIQLSVFISFINGVFN